MISILKKFQNNLLVLLILFAALLIYSPSVRIPFINDEIAFIQRNEVPSVLKLPSLFEKKDYDEFYYRPLPNFISGLTTLVFKYSPYYYRIFNLILHAISGILIYYLILNLLSETNRKKLIALFSALFFVAFPLLDYSILWHTDLFDRVMLPLYLAGLLAFVKNNFKPGVLSVVFFSLSLLSKEMAFSFPFVAGLTYLCFNKEKTNFKKCIYVMLPYLITAVVFILFRLVILNNNIFTAQDAHSAGTFIDIARNYILFTGLLIFPVYIREIQSYILVHHLISVLIGSVFAVLALFFVLRQTKKDFVLMFFILFIFITLAPASRILLRWYLYLPCVGFTSALAYLIFTVKFNKMITPLIISVIVLFFYSGSLLLKENKWIKNSTESINALNNFIGTYKSEILQNNNVVFLTIPAKIDDIPLFQLGFDKLFNFYLHDKKSVPVEVITKSFFHNYADTLLISYNQDGIQLKQIRDNYFILFNNDKNVKFDNNIYSKDNPGALTINYQEVRNKILYTFSSGAFYKLRGME
jgi:hypothetical protein